MLAQALPEERKPREYLEDDEVKELLRCLDKSYFPDYRDYIAIMLMLDSGRLREANLKALKIKAKGDITQAEAIKDKRVRDYIADSQSGGKYTSSSSDDRCKELCPSAVLRKHEACQPVAFSDRRDIQASFETERGDGQAEGFRSFQSRLAFRIHILNTRKQSCIFVM